MFEHITALECDGPSQVLAFNCELNTLYIILLALLNDLTMIPIAEDRQLAAKVT